MEDFLSYAKYKYLQCQQQRVRNNTLKFLEIDTQPAITCSKLTIETVEQGVKYVQS